MFINLANEKSLFKPCKLSCLSIQQEAVKLNCIALPDTNIFHKYFMLFIYMSLITYYKFLTTTFQSIKQVYSGSSICVYVQNTMVKQAGKADSVDTT